MPGEEPVLAGAPDDESWGLSVEPLTGEAALQLNLGISGGLLVTDIMPGSPGERAGLRRGDVIVELGKKPVADPPALYRTLAQLKPGDRVLVLIHRPASGGGARGPLLGPAPEPGTPRGPRPRAPGGGPRRAG